MKFFSIQKSFQFLTGVPFAIFVLLVLALASSIGSVIEQEETLSFYQQNYPIFRPIFGILTWKVIVQFGLDHVYRTGWFFALLGFLVVSLISCTLTRQLPIFSNSKESFFRKKKNSFVQLPFSIRIPTLYYFKETILTQLQENHFYVYQKGNCVYGYKGLIGRISPIFVHFSLIVVLFGSFLSALNNLKAQEMLPKGEVFHIQNPIQIGGLTNLPILSARVNDFWVEYEKTRIHQFYSNVSILDPYGNELHTQTISVNHPLRYKSIDLYQSDWNLLGIRLQQIPNSIIYESPLFPLEQTSKSWITWITTPQQTFTLLFDQFQNTYLIYDANGNFLDFSQVGESTLFDFSVLDLLPSTGLQMKYDPNIWMIYLGFGILMITACLSYLAYTQIWVCHETTHSWIGSSTNRGKLKLEIEFENFIRALEIKVLHTRFALKKEI